MGNHVYGFLLLSPASLPIPSPAPLDTSYDLGHSPEVAVWLKGKKGAGCFILLSRGLGGRPKRRKNGQVSPWDFSRSQHAYPQARDWMGATQMLLPQTAMGSPLKDVSYSSLVGQGKGQPSVFRGWTNPADSKRVLGVLSVRD